TSSHQNETFAISDDIGEDPYYSTPATDVSPRSITLNGENEEDGYNRIQLSVTKEIPKDRALDENYSHIRQHGDNEVYYSTPYNASEGNGDEVGSLNKSNAYSYVTKSSRSSPPKGAVLDESSSKRGVYTEGNKDNESNGKEIELIDNDVYSIEVKPDTEYEALPDEEGNKDNDSNGKEIELINNDIYSMEVKQDDHETVTKQPFKASKDVSEMYTKVDKTKNPKI
ncbi:unnamed protein product, partial [Owenia fusiformis]